MNKVKKMLKLLKTMKSFKGNETISKNIHALLPYKYVHVFFMNASFTT